MRFMGPSKAQDLLERQDCVGLYQQELLHHGNPCLRGSTKLLQALNSDAQNAVP